MTINVKYSTLVSNTGAKHWNLFGLEERGLGFQAALTSSALYLFARHFCV